MSVLTYTLSPYYATSRPGKEVIDLTALAISKASKRSTAENPGKVL